MTSDPRDQELELERILDGIVESILEAPEDELDADLRAAGDEPDIAAGRLRARLERTSKTALYVWAFFLGAYERQLSPQMTIARIAGATCRDNWCWQGLWTRRVAADEDRKDCGRDSSLRVTIAGLAGEICRYISRWHRLTPPISSDLSVCVCDEKLNRLVRIHAHLDHVLRSRSDLASDLS